MPRHSATHLLDQLDESRRQFGSNADRTTHRLLKQLGGTNFNNPEELLRFHELLLFVVAYPQNSLNRNTAESLLRSFARRIDRLRKLDADLSSLETPEVSGIDGCWVTDTFTFPIVRWLAERFPRKLEFDWEWFEGDNRLGESWPRFMPLLEEDAYVEAHVPFRDWLNAARSGNEVAWLINQFRSLGSSDLDRAEIYDSLGLYVQWTPPYRSTRTGMRLPGRQVFYHRAPLIRRKEVSLEQELNSPPPSLTKLTEQEGTRILDMAREASTLRYRELYGFTHGDARRVLKAEIGRGVELFISGLPPEKRLPLRAYHAAMIFKNGVPVGYFEGLSLCERMESGFNLYYTFRDGETAWLYARLLNVFHHLLGVNSFAIDPYQVGFENEEGIESGAFWFYRKLGFRPTDRDVAKLTERQEEKLSKRQGYRTSAATLRKLAVSPMIYEMDAARRGDWDGFHIRNIGLAAQRMMSKNYDGNSEAFRKAAMKTVAGQLGIHVTSLKAEQLKVYSDFFVTLSLVPDLSTWSREDKAGVLKIIKAKASADEADYLKMMQRHQRLRRAVIDLGTH